METANHPERVVPERRSSRHRPHVSATPDMAPRPADGGEVTDVERRLTTEFSGLVPPAEVSRCVARVATGFEGAPVRVYVPVLVERIARQWLRDAVREAVAERPVLTVVADGPRTGSG